MPTSESPWQPNDKAFRIILEQVSLVIGSTRNRKEPGRELTSWAAVQSGSLADETHPTPTPTATPTPTPTPWGHVCLLSDQRTFLQPPEGRWYLTYYPAATEIWLEAKGRNVRFETNFCFVRIVTEFRCLMAICQLSDRMRMDSHKVARKAWSRITVTDCRKAFDMLRNMLVIKPNAVAIL